MAKHRSKSSRGSIRVERRRIVRFDLGEFEGSLWSDSDRVDVIDPQTLQVRSLSELSTVHSAQSKGRCRRFHGRLRNLQ